MLLLALRAPVGLPALLDHLYRVTVSRAGFALMPMHHTVVPAGSAPRVDETGFAAEPDALSESRLDLVEKLLCFLVRELTDLPEGVEPGVPENLVSPGIADAADQLLVGDRRLQLLAPGKQLPEPAQIKGASRVVRLLPLVPRFLQGV